MKTFLFPIYLILFVLGATALWYFGHHRPAQKILTTEHRRIIKSVPITPKPVELQTAPHSHTHPDNVVDHDTQTPTPLTTEHNFTPRVDPTAPESAVESQTAMSNDDAALPPEHTEVSHSHSEEEAAAESAKSEALLAESSATLEEAREYLKRAEFEKQRMASEMTEFFNTLSIEEQQNLFTMFRKIVYVDIPLQHPGEDTQADLDSLWNSVLLSLIDAGYTPPDSVDFH